MKTSDVMTQEVISIQPTATIAEAAHLMLSTHISGLPVIDASGALVGIVTEGDFLRRGELSTQKHRSRWISFLLGSDASVDSYIRSHSRRVSEVMSRVIHVVDEDTPLDEVVRLMEIKRIKRLPVMRGSHVVGIISRANLLHALAAAMPMEPTTASDQTIRHQLTAALKELDGQTQGVNFVVKNGVVDLWGTVFANRDAFRIAAENIPGVKEVRDHLLWIEPMSGTIVESEDVISGPVPPEGKRGK